MEPAALSQQYYVGQNGDQSGPFSEADILSQIQQGLIQPDALVWHEGMPEWQPIRNFDRFSEAFNGAAGGELPMAGAILNEQEPWETKAPGRAMANPLEGEENEEAKARAVSKKGLKKIRHSEVSTFAFSDKEAKPIYRDNVFSATAKYIKRRFSMVFFGAILFAVGYGGYHFFVSVISPEEGGETVVETPKKRGRGFPKNRGTAATTTPNAAPGEAAKSSAIPVIDNNERALELQKAKSELLLNSGESLATFERLIEANPEDATGKEALEAGLIYYKTNQRRVDAGRLLMKAKKPLEASKYFLEEPAQWELAEEALFAAYRQSRAADRADILIQDINVLLGPLGRPEVARERIRVLEKDFPRRKHPFAYYLKSIDGRIADIFNRLSFYFVQSLLGHVGSEFSAMTWTERPVVEILRLRDGKYRIVGRYKGDVILHRDKMSNINFVFWMEGEFWRLVETNVTEERSRFAASEKERLKARSVLAAQMLESLENRFRSKFPKARLHEAVSEGADDTRRTAAE